MDFSNLSAPKKIDGSTDPVEIFQKSKVVDPAINDLWLAQGDALREWDSSRANSDVSIVLNTGAGKTLVGLLIAQSLVNETRGKVLYACSSIQLVEQTAEKAEGYGFPICTYFRQKFSNDLYSQGRAPCLTTYQALFNGKSKFFRDDINAVVFDDAHAADNLLRDHFSLSIDRAVFPHLYEEILALYKSYFRTIGKNGSFEEIKSGNSSQLLFVPPFVVIKAEQELARVLGDGGVAAESSTLFAWQHLKDRLDLCCLFIEPGRITITPPFVPTRTLPYFKADVRRVYLSATLTARDSFARTFGSTPSTVIAPKTTAGECERMVLFPSKVDEIGAEDVGATKSLISEKKTLILVPTYRRASEWEDVATLPAKDQVTTTVNNFKLSEKSEKLILAARFDGLDLPGDSCRVMVIDDLPAAVGPLDRFLWENLGLSNTLRTTIASRVVQSFGRISRGMSDYGVVIITGEKLVNWLQVPRNVRLIPEFLQRQISLGIEISKAAGSKDNLEDSMCQSSQRSSDWLGAYERLMDTIDALPKADGDQALVELAEAEARYARAIWDRDYERAAIELREALGPAFDISESTGAWYALWGGYALERAGDKVGAETLYTRSHSAEKNIPPLPVMNAQNDQYAPQVIEIARQFSTGGGSFVNAPANVDSELTGLAGHGTTNQVEQSVCALGRFLGFESSRPDNEFGTGPDILWCLPNSVGLCFEAKTNKINGVYKKSEIGQMPDHVEWVKANKHVTGVIPIFIGPMVPASSSANPNDEVRVVELATLLALSEKIVAALGDVAKSSLPISLNATVEEEFSGRTLLWPDLFDQLNSRILLEIQE